MFPAGILLVRTSFTDIELHLYSDQDQADNSLTKADFPFVGVFCKIDTSITRAYISTWIFIYLLYIYTLSRYKTSVELRNIPFEGKYTRYVLPRKLETFMYRPLIDIFCIHNVEWQRLMQNLYLMCLKLLKIHLSIINLFKST